jgi:hypothetical protein
MVIKDRNSIFKQLLNPLIVRVTQLGDQTQNKGGVVPVIITEQEFCCCYKENSSVLISSCGILHPGKKMTGINYFSIQP